MDSIRSATFADLDVDSLYMLMRLRIQVFVVEQNCPYEELDGRDTEPGTIHLWIERDGLPVCYLRLLSDGSQGRIGRVCAAKTARGQGLPDRLMAEAVRLAGSQSIVLDAQVGAARLYERHGFSANGPEFLEDGIPHIPMHRPATATG